MNTKDGGPAFPSITETWVEYGMSLRDWFAGRALAAIIGSLGKAVQPNDRYANGVRVALAKEAYAYADAMLAARAKKDE